MRFIDLNCDMGEGVGNDAALMDFVSSANIACGFHAGDAATMRSTVEIAIEKNVAIGAHPSYPDRQNFGRTAMHLPLSTVFEIVVEQIEALRHICSAAGGRLYHVKPHGALYNQAANDLELARTIAEAVKTVDPGLILFGLSGSLSIDAGKKAGLKTAAEVFADRSYGRDGKLTPRTEPNALITDETAAVGQVLQMVNEQTVTALDGSVILIAAETICIHGDGEYALGFAAAAHRELTKHGITISRVNG